MSIRPSGLLLVLTVAACAPAQDRPNIVLIVADDQDNQHLGFMGNEVPHTPNLDRLANEGTVFTTLHTPPRCRPSLACLLSGRWPHQSGIYYNRGPRELPAAGSLPELLREAGYATFQGGKFWEGEPAEMGFEAVGRDQKTFVREGQEALLAFVDELGGVQPMFVWWAPKIPHMPHDPPQEYLDRFPADGIPLPSWFPDFADAAVFREFEQRSLAMGAWFDAALGAFLDELRSVGEYENTLFLFLIDNGFCNGLPAKGSPFEKGISTPLIVTWGGHVPSGQRLELLVDEVDVFPTILDYAGVAAPEAASGRSLRPAIEGAAFEPRKTLHGVVYQRHALDQQGRPQRDAYAIYARSDRWKYILYLTDVTPPMWDIMTVKPLVPLERARGDEDLFDLENDPYELEDLSADPAHRARMDELRAGALRWWKETGGKPLDLP